MKANELMIGDWVSVTNTQGNKVNVRILTLADGGSTTCEELPARRCCVYSTYNNEKFEPIPLTKEILERNGFKFYDIYDSYDSYHLTFDIDITYKGHTETFTHDVTLQHCTEDDFSWDFMGTNGSCIFNIEYVHELQHALRLCGINKEIEL